MEHGCGTGAPAVNAKLVSHSYVACSLRAGSAQTFNEHCRDGDDGTFTVEDLRMVMMDYGTVCATRAAHLCRCRYRPW